MWLWCNSQAMHSLASKQGERVLTEHLKLKKKKKFKYVILSTDNLVTVKKYPKGSYSGDIKVAYSFASHTPKNTQSE